MTSNPVTRVSDVMGLIDMMLWNGKYKVMSQTSCISPHHVHYLQTPPNVFLASHPFVIGPLLSLQCTLRSMLMHFLGLEHSHPLCHRHQYNLPKLTVNYPACQGGSLLIRNPEIMWPFHQFFCALQCASCRVIVTTSYRKTAAAAFLENSSMYN